MESVQASLNASPSPVLELTSMDRADLAVLVGTGGFRIIQKIMRSAVDKFILSLVNADSASDAEVLAKHKLAKAATQFYAQVIKDVNEELIQIKNEPKPTDKPIDVTAGIFDIGDTATEELLRGEENEF